MLSQTETGSQNLDREQTNEAGIPYIFVPLLVIQDGGANRAFVRLDEDSCAYRHVFVDVIL